MRELKWNWVYYPYLDTPDKQKESALKAGYIKVYTKSEVDKELRHQKYRRCLTMAKLCHWKMGVFIYKEEKWNFYHRWHNRWLELAERFKEDI